MTPGKEKKAPEHVQYWNSTLAREIEAEVDLYLQHKFTVELDEAELLQLKAYQDSIMLLQISATSLE